LVPVKLELKNFMCYKDATLELDGVHLACLSGDNGAGKSAILDAITWSLWGKARAGADELIALGEIEMRTDLAKGPVIPS
jgi:DNA repair protein SbcC/Rad50